MCTGWKIGGSGKRVERGIAEPASPGRLRVTSNPNETTGITKRNTVCAFLLPTAFTTKSLGAAKTILRHKQKFFVLSFRRGGSTTRDRTFFLSYCFYPAIRFYPQTRGTNADINLYVCIYIYMYMRERTTGTVRFIARHFRPGNEKCFDEDCAIYHTAGIACFACLFFREGAANPNIFTSTGARLFEHEKFCSLTGIEGHLADHDPSVGEVEPQLHVLADSMMELDGDVSR